MPLVDRITTGDIAKVFPQAPKRNILTNWPRIQAAIRYSGMGDDDELIAYILGTIAAEDAKFSPDPEQPSRLSGWKERPFGSYDNDIRTNRKGRLVINRDLGNRLPPGPWSLKVAKQGRDGEPFGPDYNDGERYRGRGYLQLSGRYNYEQANKALKRAGYDFDLVSFPDLAGSPGPAERILVDFVFSRQRMIKRAMTGKDFEAARRYVNARAEGMGRFLEAIKRYENLNVRGRLQTKPDIRLKRP